MDKLLLRKNDFPKDILQDIRRVGSILLRHGALRIILYGSLARGDYRANSDIDFCVEGLPDELYFRAIAECLMISRRPVSVLDFKTVHGYLREKILQEGRILYEHE